MKRCARCGDMKPLGAFSRHTRSADGRQSYCKACATERHREFELKARYGITVAEYEVLRALQGGKCASCGRAEEDVATRVAPRLVVDHVKGTKKVRGLLCGSCNLANGLCDHDSEWLRRCADYLERSRRDADLRGALVKFVLAP